MNRRYSTSRAAIACRINRACNRRRSGVGGRNARARNVLLATFDCGTTFNIRNHSGWLLQAHITTPRTVVGLRCGGFRFDQLWIMQSAAALRHFPIAAQQFAKLWPWVFDIPMLLCGFPKPVWDFDLILAISHLAFSSLSATEPQLPRSTSRPGHSISRPCLILVHKSGPHHRVKPMSPGRHRV
jgi:hypothetical protein